MKIKRELMKRDIAGECFLVPIGKTVYDANGLFMLTEVGSFLWDRLPGANGIDELVCAVLEEYEVDEATARADIEVFLNRLGSMGIL